MDFRMTLKKVLFLWNIREELKTYLISHLSDISELELQFTENVEEDFTPESPYIREADIIIGWRPSIELLESLLLFLHSLLQLDLLLFHISLIHLLVVCILSHLFAI